MKNFSVPIFGARIWHTQDQEEAQSWIDRRKFDEKLFGIDGIFIGQDGQYLIYTKHGGHGLLAHESHHAAHEILRYIGAESADEEVVSHLLEYICERCATLS